MDQRAISGKNLRADTIESSITRAFMQGAGYSREDLKSKPVIGICNSWSELNPCNLNLKFIAENVKKGIIAAGGIPVEFPTISINEQTNTSSSLYLRNLMAMDVEEMIKRSPIDGVVLLNGCDKTVPAQIMGALSAGKPMISMSAGPRPTSTYKGEVTTIHNLWEKKEEREKGEIDDTSWETFTDQLIPGLGTCNVMGTASTMSAIVEALGLSIPGTAFLPSTCSSRQHAAENTGKVAVQLVKNNRTPDQIVNIQALENAFRVVCALGGSTNAVIHLEAIAGRIGLRLGLDNLREWSETTPQLVSVIPSGPYKLEDLQDVGGIPALFKNLSRLLHLDTQSVTGQTWEDIISTISGVTSGVLKDFDNPVKSNGGLAILQGSLAPNGALFKRSAVPEEYWKHSGPAVVFDGIEDMKERIDSPHLEVESDSVLILRGMGPIGGPGMPEDAKIPIPKKLWEKGVRNMLRISDGRMSGTADGAVVLHVSPESAAGGPLAIVEDGDIVELDAVTCCLNLHVSEEEMRKRMKKVIAKEKPSRGYERLYHDHVTQADLGADFDFLIKQESTVFK